MISRRATIAVFISTLGAKSCDAIKAAESMIIQPGEDEDPFSRPINLLTVDVETDDSITIRYIYSGDDSRGGQADTYEACIKLDPGATSQLVGISGIINVPYNKASDVYGLMQRAGTDWRYAFGNLNEPTAALLKFIVSDTLLKILVEESFPPMLFLTVIAIANGSLHIPIVPTPGSNSFGNPNTSSTSSNSGVSNNNSSSGTTLPAPSSGRDNDIAPRGMIHEPREAAPSRGCRATTGRWGTTIDC